MPVSVAMPFWISASGSVCFDMWRNLSISSAARCCAIVRSAPGTVQGA